ncbi:MarR family winged helix-turn-helix transcriptional regulator [Brevibacterium sp. CFH 10365]|uniref:MarR family winged helix-turn-helix transcriptional regulator n=1 Tax=Brevibacterium sp. CFH 10365 TaxID=2585207 RepID=UPI0012662897|nr:MarR family transcriptional regulator [Brevibacterium sp. CFH 10365]
MTEIRFGLGREALAQNAWRTYFETSQRIRQALEVQLKDDAGLDVSDYNTLLLLWEAPDRTLTMSALAKKLVFSPSRLNYRIKVLVDAGLVTKTQCPEDGRAHNVALTEAGARAFLAAGSQHKSYVDEIFFGHVSDAELEVIEAVFTRIGDALPEC